MVITGQQFTVASFVSQHPILLITVFRHEATNVHSHVKARIIANSPQLRGLSIFIDTIKTAIKLSILHLRLHTVVDRGIYITICTVCSFAVL